MKAWRAHKNAETKGFPFNSRMLINKLIEMAKGFSIEGHSDKI